MAYAFGARKSSQYRGVGYHKSSGKWQATIWYDGKLHHIGLFVKETEAARAYDEKAQEVWGADADLNFPVRRKGRHKASLDSTRMAVVSPDEVADAVMAVLDQSLSSDPLVKRALVKRAVAELTSKSPS